MTTRASLHLIGMVGVLCLGACSSESSETDTGTKNPGQGGQAGAGPGGASGKSGSSGQTSAGQGGASAGQGGSSGNSGQSGASGSSPSGGQGGQGSGAAGQGQAGASTAGQGGQPNVGGASGEGGFGASAGQGNGGKDPGPSCPTEQACAGFKSPPGQGEPPPVASGAAPAEGSTVVYAFDRLLLGDTDLEGSVNDQAWRLYGFNQDGWNSTPAQGYHCKPIAGAKDADIRQDGVNGLDNSFGKNVVNGILSVLIANPSDKVTEPILGGQKSYLIDVAALGAQGSYASLAGGLGDAQGTKTGDQFVPPPANDWSSYTWHPLQGSRVAFSEAYLANNVLVARFAESVPVSLIQLIFPFNIPVKRAALVMDVSDRSRGTMGMLGGLIPTEEMILAFQKSAGMVDTKFCDPNSPALVGILDSIRGASDSLLDGTQDPDRDCDAISLGLGFTARATLMGAPVTPPPLPDPCVQ